MSDSKSLSEFSLYDMVKCYLIIILLSKFCLENAICLIITSVAYIQMHSRLILSWRKML